MIILDKNLVPPGTWQYLEESTGYKIKAPSYQDLIKRIEAHRLSNNLDLSIGWIDKVEAELCKTLPSGRCGPKNPVIKPDERTVGLRDIKNFMLTVINWKKSGGEFVDQDEAESRASICASCPNNVVIKGCTGCNGLGALAVNKIRKDKRTRQDDKLNSCKICACMMKVKVHLPLEIMNSNGLEEFPSHCWMNDSTDQD